VKNALWVILLLLSSSVAGTTYYIDPSGNNSNNGSSTSPWKTLAYACSKATVSGDIIHVNAGTYIETTQSVLAVGVSMVGVGNTSIIQSEITAAYTFSILLSSSYQGTNGNQSISDIRMEGGMQAYGAILIDKRKNVSIHNCEFEDFFTRGVTFTGSGYNSDAIPSAYATGNSFHDNKITNCADYAGSGHYGCGFGNLEVGGQLGMLVYNNTITQEDRGTDANGYCIKYCSNGYCKGLKIYNNRIVKPPYDGSTWDFSMELWNCRGGIEIYNNNIQGSIDFGGNTSVTNDDGGYGYAVKVYKNTIGQSVMRTRDENGIDLEREQTGGFYVYDNLFKNLASALVMCQAGGDYFRDFYVYYNIFNNIGVSGQAKYGNGIDWLTIDTDNVTYDNINFLNNTVCAGTGGSPQSGLRFSFHGSATNVTVRNNIIQGFYACPVYMQSPGTITNVSIENNLFYNNGNSNSPKFDRNIPTNITTQNNITGNPLFISSADFHLQAGSPAIGKGLVLTGITLDYEGNAVKNPPGIGAYEYASIPPVPDAPVFQSASVENATPTLLEMTYNITLNISVVPATSSYNVLVNSLARTINSVTISGNKVRLTLSGAIKYGDIITLSYTKPASSPLQSTSGGIAANISSKSVTNNVIASIPVYISSVVENITPSIIGITFSLALANIVPSGSAFNVQVNSVMRNVSSVSVSGINVNLTLGSPVKFGDIITLSYTKPAGNPLQSTSGGQVSNISYIAVTNNCNEVIKANDPPIVAINYPEIVYGGFVAEIDASSTYDPNNDTLTAEWVVPNDVPISSGNSLKIEFLAPFVNDSRTISFELKVSDGEAVSTTDFTINVRPYKPELAAASISNVTGSDCMIPDYPVNAIDGNINTKWTSDGDDKWLMFTLDVPFKINNLALAFLQGQNYESYFDILASRDNATWDKILTGEASCKFSGERQVFDIPALYSNTEYLYFKFVGHGNSLNLLNNVSEIKLFGTPQQNSNQSGSKGKNISIYPNPAQSSVNISIDEPLLDLNSIRIITFSGKIVFEDAFVEGTNNVQLPYNLNSGIYLVEFRSGSTILNTQKLIILK